MTEPIQLVVKDVDDVKCSPWGNLIGCPVTLYTVIVVIFAIWQLYNIINAPTVNNDGQPISAASRWGWGLAILIIYLLIAYAFGSWMYKLCTKNPGCGSGGAWLVFLLAIFFPIILGVIATILFGVIIGVGSAVAKGKGGKQMPQISTSGGGFDVSRNPAGGFTITPPEEINVGGA